MNRCNVVITENELELIRTVIKNWLHHDKYCQMGNQDMVDEVTALLKSLPLPNHEMEPPQGCEYCGKSECNCDD